MAPPSVRQPTILVSFDSSEIEWRFPTASVSSLAELGPVHTVESPVSHDAISDLAREAEVPLIVVGDSATGVDLKFIRSLPQMVAYVRSGQEVRNVDLKGATQEGVVVANTPGHFAVPVAEYTIAQIINLARNIGKNLQDVAAGHTPERSEFVGSNVRGKTLGIVGYGSVGKEVANLARVIGMNVVVHDPFASHSGPEVYVPLEDLCETADFISVHAASNEETVGLIGEAHLRRMRPTSFLLNTSRGPLVDADALARAISERRLAGAAIDVYDEVSFLSSPLMGLPGVLATSHIAGFSREAYRQQAEDTVRVVSAIVSNCLGDVHVLNPEVLQSDRLRLDRFASRSGGEFRK